MLDLLQNYELVPEWREYQVNLPQTTFPPYTIDHVTLDADTLGPYLGVDPREWVMGRGIAPGTYTRLWEPETDPEMKRSRLIWMSDTPAEIIDHWKPILHLRENEPTGEPVLITGLGIGMVVNAALKHGRNVHVIESNIKIIQMVGSHYHSLADKNGVELHIHHGDALTWVPRKQIEFEYIWHDIWPHISDMNIFEMLNMFKRYKRYLAPGGQMGAWAIYECLSMDFTRRVDRSDEENEDLLTMLADMLDGDWDLIDDFYEAYVDGRIPEDMPEVSA